MAETVTIESTPYLKRNPLGVLGLSFITLGIYFFYWYWKINDELSNFGHDDTISPSRSLTAILFGWIIIVPPFIAIYNTSKTSKEASDTGQLLELTSRSDADDLGRALICRTSPERP